MKKILGASIGSCVHVAGVINFLNLAQQYGYQTRFLGPACKFEQIYRGHRRNKSRIL
ncbi:MAG: hypothetical protein U5N58_04595 [Actinomycetota bacterium]|nr:hypothetical protein [Actinomycetota bacterium]